MLKIDDIHVSFGKAQVLRGLDLTCEAGEVVGIIGPNGAGKSTLVNTLAGLNPAKAGTFTIDGEAIPLGDPLPLVKAGVRLVPQGRSLFGSMTVEENLKMGAFTQRSKHAWREQLEQVGPLFPEVLDRLGERAANLSGGQQQLVAILRGLMSPARALFLDEPSLGVAPIIVDRIAQILRDLVAQTGLHILLVEQNLRLATSASDRIAVLARGRTALVARPDEVSGPEGEQRLKDVFFGEAHAQQSGATST